MCYDVIREYSLDLLDDDGPADEDRENAEWDEVDRAYDLEGEDE